MDHLSFEQGRPQEVICSSEKYQGYGEVSTKKTFKSISSNSCSGKKACWKSNLLEKCDTEKRK